MLKAFDVWAKSGNPGMSTVDIARSAELKAETIYQWRQDAEYLRWWRDQANDFFAKEIPDVWKATFARAKAGDMQAAKLCFQGYDGGRMTQKHEVSGPGGGPMSMRVLTDEQLEDVIARLASQK